MIDLTPTHKISKDIILTGDIKYPSNSKCKTLTWKEAFRLDPCLESSSSYLLYKNYLGLKDMVPFVFENETYVRMFDLRSDGELIPL